MRPLGLVLLLGLVPVGLLGQDVPSEPQDAPSLVCFRSRPLPACRTSLITDVSANTLRYGGQRSEALHLQWDLGALVNLDARNAVGLSASFGDKGSGRWGLAARYRRWLSGSSALEVAPGFLVKEEPRARSWTFITGEVALVQGGWVAVFVRGEAGGGQGRLGVGLRLMSWPGLVLGAVSHYFLGSFHGYT